MKELIIMVFKPVYYAAAIAFAIWTVCMMYWFPYFLYKLAVEIWQRWRIKRLQRDILSLATQWKAANDEQAERRFFRRIGQ